jgi:hypothetical protein
MPRCAGTKADGTPCERIVGAAHRFCFAHDPKRAAERSRNAAKAARSKPSKELATVKERLRKLAEQVLAGEVAEDPAGVAARIYGVYLRAVEQERRVREQDELLARIEALEQRQGGSYGLR